MTLSGTKDNADCWSAASIGGFRSNLLRWYDRERRDLPWRAKPGNASDPYHVWLSEVMLQQTTVPAVIPYFLKFTARWPSIHDLAAAPAEDLMREWAGLGYYARARNLLKCAREVAATTAGIFPDREEDLRALPGIGPYTAAAIAAIAFGRPANVVDGNVERVMARYFAVTDPLPAAKPELKERARALTEGCADRPGDYAQALMDLGATVCTPKSPDCRACPLRGDCRGLAQGIAASLPARSLKSRKPVRRGHVYMLRDGRGNVLLHRRPEKGLLGGMVALPTSEWIKEGTPGHAGFIKDPSCLRHSGFTVLHTFTHFHLELEGWSGAVDADAAAVQDDGFFFASESSLTVSGLPSVFLKAARAFLAGRSKVA